MPTSSPGIGSIAGRQIVGNGGFLAQIQDHRAFSVLSKTWAYKFVECNLNITFVDVGGLQVPDSYGVSIHEKATTGWAINLAEGASETIIFGIDTEGTSINQFEARPIDGGGTTDLSKTNPIVQIFTQLDSNHKPFYWFSRQGSFDGVCSDETSSSAGAEQAAMSQSFGST